MDRCPVTGESFMLAFVVFVLILIGHFMGRLARPSRTNNTSIPSSSSSRANRLELLARFDRFQRIVTQNQGWLHDKVERSLA